jgi:natural product biosynthesis luciferase-like monooxygenase protein
MLQWRALHQADQLAFTFLGEGVKNNSTLTYGELDQKARVIALFLKSIKAEKKHALLVYNPGLEFITAIFGCLYARVVAIPIYPPRKNFSLNRIETIIEDSQASLALTTGGILSDVLAKFSDNARIKSLNWIATDEINSSFSSEWNAEPVNCEETAFLQYTSGSTGMPKGVIVSHKNLIHNSEIIKRAFGHDEKTVGVGWLPLYHDMGLIGYVFQPVYYGGHCVLMSPVSFLQKPIRWLQAISDFKATTSGGPNFAYDLCIKNITAEQINNLDLASWDVAFNGAEPIRIETVETFSKTFAPAGFHKQAFYPCYGLAEATLLVTGGIKGADFAITTKNGNKIPGCGHTWLNQKVVIADPLTLNRCAENEEGEIWVRGDSVAMGYWNKPKENNTVFKAYLADTGEGPFLRTGDLGYLNKEQLYITARLKDLIIIRGKNYYPHDIELVVEQSHATLRTGNGAAFSLYIDGEERLVIAYEVERSFVKNQNVEEVSDCVREAVSQHFELQAYAVLLLRTASIPKTSSGKIQRQQCKEAFIAGKLNIIASSYINRRDKERKYIHELFEQRAIENSDAIAFGFEDKIITYRQLDQKANQIAHYLRNEGIENSSSIGIYSNDTIEIITAILGILKAGRSFVLLDDSKAPGEIAADAKENKTFLLISGNKIKAISFLISKYFSLDIFSDPGCKEDADLQINSAPIAINDIDRSGEKLVTNNLSHKDIIEYFLQLDRLSKHKTGDILITEKSNLTILPLLEVIWVLTHAGKIVFFESIVPKEKLSLSEQGKPGANMDFSLFYFSSNENEFTSNKYKLVIEGAKYADKNGFTAIWTPERHFHAFGGLYPNPSVLTSAIAMVTKNIRLRAGSVVLPLHHPVRVAEEWAVVDNLSDGRVDIAFARGWNPNDFIFAPERFDKSKELLFSGIETVKKLWRGEKIIASNGVGKDIEIKIYPLPKQPELQTWVTCSGGKERFTEAGACGSNVLTALLFQSTEELAEKIQAYRKSLEEHGFDPEMGKVTLMQHTFIGPDIETVRSKVRGPFIEYLKNSYDLWKGESQALEKLSETEREKMLDYSFERYFHTSALFGTPESCAHVVEQFKVIGVNEIACLIDFGIEQEEVLTHLYFLKSLKDIVNKKSEQITPTNGKEYFFINSLNKQLAPILHCTAETVLQLSNFEPEFLSSCKFFMLNDDPFIHYNTAPVIGKKFRSELLFKNVSISSAFNSAEMPGADKQTVQQDDLQPKPGRIYTDQDIPIALPDILQDAIKAEIALLLQIDPQIIPGDKNFHSMGIDSVKAIEIIHKLGQRFSISLSPVALFEAPTPFLLSEYIIKNYREALENYMVLKKQPIPTITPAENELKTGPGNPGSYKEEITMEKLQEYSETQLAELLSKEINEQ